MDVLINGQVHHLPGDAVDPAMPLLWVLREVLDLTGTKFGCGVAACGACTVHLAGEAARSCTVPLSALAGRPVTTIEGLGSPAAPHPLQQAWVAHQVSQCGYCQSGMLMAAAALLKRNRRPSDADIDAAITNLCRCGTYPRVRAAIQTAAAVLRGESPKPGQKVAPGPVVKPAVASPSGGRRAAVRA